MATLCDELATAISGDRLHPIRTRAFGSFTPRPLARTMHAAVSGEHTARELQGSALLNGQPTLDSLLAAGDGVRLPTSAALVKNTHLLARGGRCSNVLCKRVKTRRLRGQVTGSRPFLSALRFSQIAQKYLAGHDPSPLCSDIGNIWCAGCMPSRPRWTVAQCDPYRHANKGPAAMARGGAL